MSKKVPVQKGEINSKQKTSKTLSQLEKLEEKIVHDHFKKTGQTLEFVTPKMK